MYPDSLDEVEDVEQRARSYVQLVRSLQPQGPYVLTGYCAGGHVAFEMAQQLIAAGDEVAFVGMINCRMPGYPSSRIVKSVVKLQRLLHEVGAARSEGQGILEYGKTKLSARRTAVAEREQLREVRERVCAQGFQQVPDDNQNEVLLQATAEAFGRYRPRPLPGRIALFISQDPELLGVSRRFDPRVRWQEFAEGADIWEFPGGHSIIEMEDQTAFAKRLKEAIDRTVGSNATRRRASGE
jgi:phthiocerol/phenolphthiocerol synthesis type-I polyketide synthase D